MKRICLLGVCLFGLLTSVGCCYRQGGIDPMTGMAYGGVVRPACNGFLDPLGFWCWASGLHPYAPGNQYGYPGSVVPMSPYGSSPYSSFPPGAIYEDPCGGCGNAYPTFQGQFEGQYLGPVEYGYPPNAPSSATPTERDDLKEKPEKSAENISTTHFQTTWAKPVGDGSGVVAH